MVGYEGHAAVDLTLPHHDCQCPCGECPDKKFAPRISQCRHRVRCTACDAVCLVDHNDGNAEYIEIECPECGSGEMRVQEYVAQIAARNNRRKISREAAN